MNSQETDGVEECASHSVTAEDIEDFVPVIGEYANARRGVFPSKHSARYFLRHHGPRLIDLGIGLQIGNRWHVIPKRCDAYIIRVLQRDGGFKPRRSRKASRRRERK